MGFWLWGLVRGLECHSGIEPKPVMFRTLSPGGYLVYRSFSACSAYIRTLGYNLKPKTLNPWIVMDKAP